ncbi:src substrate protein p85-like isoform X5 [Megalobrama amblycephala]|uniref:src substrate protein p85-like isoform X5 n=1 Tax=Megalobrama amblycephala TaxID=75352 RepID=UPI002013F275|nr:src substrate protein p85-like isoform X5 [Megalobrama amblycephala]
MWKAVVGHDVNVKVESEGDDWETDPNFENDVSEQEQRWGARTIEGSGRKEHISIAELRQNVSREHEVVKKKEMDQGPKASYGYGGKFGVEKDRMDKGALGHGYVAEVEQHSSQTDAAKGFGGKFGVQKDRVDKSAMTYEYKGEVQQHASQKDYAKGFGGKYGVQKERVDKAAMGYDYKGETEKHQSQKDYAKGFGGRYGVEADRMDKSAASFSEMESPSSAYEKPKAFEASSVGAGNLKARFENMAKASDEENKKRADEERARRLAREKREREEAQRKQEEQSKHEEEEENQRPPPVPASQKPQKAFRNLPEIPRDEPETEPQVEEQPDYEEPPCLPPRPADLIEEEEEPEPEELYAECDPDPIPQDEDYEDIVSYAPPAIPAVVDNDYEDLSVGGQTAKAIYDYQGEASDEISFMPDDIITNIEMVDEGWWKGTCHGRTGLFPATFVELM